MIGFGFTSHWSRNWLEIFVPTAKRSKGKPKQMLITFDTQVETALISRFGCASSKFDEACGLQAIPHRKLTVFVPREAESKEGVSLANQKLFSLPAVFYIFSVFYFSYILYLVFLLIYRPRYQRQNDNNTQGRETPLAAYTNTSSNLMLRDEAPAFLQSPRPGDALNRENQPGPVSPDQEYMALTPVTKSGNWEITREHVQVVRMIGKGAFSQVAKALAWNISGVKGVTTVAVKMLKEDAPYSDRQDLLSELELMKKLKPHPHVIKLMGCITETEPLLVLIEYIPYGDLLGYLRKSRSLNDMYFEDQDVKPETQLTSQQLMRFSQQIADGMSYLCSKKIIHRDLAARNVLVGEGEKCKVTDFGMARNVHQDDFYTRQSQDRLPVKWTAYEGLLYGTYTTQSDVWSFGVVLYEIFTVGGSPYPRINSREIANKLQQGYRMPKPKHVDEQLYQIMLQCWQQNPNDRPTFSMLKDAITEMAQNEQDTYVNMKEYDTSLYSNVDDLFAGNRAFITC